MKRLLDVVVVEDPPFALLNTVALFEPVDDALDEGEEEEEEAASTASSSLILVAQ